MSKHLTIAGTGTKFPLRFNFAHAAGVMCLCYSETISTALESIGKWVYQFNIFLEI